MFRSVTGPLLTFGGFFGFVGFLFGAQATREVVGWVDAQTWTETRCAITDVRIMEWTDEWEDARTWAPGYTYDFATDPAHTFERSGYHDATFDSREAAVQAAMDRAVGTQVPCWYDPDDPRRSTLSRDAPWRQAALAAGLFGAGVVLVLLGVLFRGRTAPHGSSGGPGTLH